MGNQHVMFIPTINKILKQHKFINKKYKMLVYIN